ncbi:MAG: hypothetical protein ACK4OE_01725 [Acidovorax sp.]
MHSAYEFKDIFDRTGEYTGPFCCPFCEVSYIDKCIKTPCVKAPHFSLVPNGPGHLGQCNGEPARYSEIAAVVDEIKKPRRKVVGEIEFPEALVAASPVRARFKKSGDGQRPLQDEVERRRHGVDVTGFQASKFTSSLLRTFVFAHRRLKELAREHAQKSAAPSTLEFKRTYREVMESKPLELYGERLTYNDVFINSRLSPPGKPRIFQGRGWVGQEGDELVIRDGDAWPEEPRSSVKLEFFVVTDANIAECAPRTHRQLHSKLVDAARAGDPVHWHAFGSVLYSDAKQFVLRVMSLDHLFLEQ